MLRFLALLIFVVLPWSLWAQTTKECQDKAAACAKANNCAKKAESKECKACRANYEKCVAGAPETRGKKTAKKATK